MEFKITLISGKDKTVHNEVLDIGKGNYRVGAYRKQGDKKTSYYGHIRVEYIETHLKPYFNLVADYDYMVICGSGENAATARRYGFLKSGCYALN